MARVVQRRTTPPYLLILFVFLFLIATAMSVMFYINWDKANKDLDTLRKDAYRTIQPADEDAAIKAMKDVAAKSSAQTVVQQLKKQVQALAHGITPGQETFEAAKAAMDKEGQKYEGEYGSLGLVALVNRINEKLKEQTARAEELANERKKLEEEKIQLVKDMDELRAKQVQDLAKLNQGLKDLEGKVGLGHKEYQDQLKKLTDEINGKLAEYEKNINDKLAQINKLKGDVKDRDDKIRELLDRIARSEGTTDPSKVRVTADGKIVKLMDGQKLAYVNIGAKDNVHVGLTLAVFPFTGIPEDPDAKPKGKLRVVNVYVNTSECRITEESDKDPLTQDDLVANLAHDTARSYLFVVEGVFDLRGTGAPTPTGADDVKELIKQSGGRLTDVVDINTDFVVMGDTPPAPTKPPEGAPPQVEKVYREQLKAIERYNEVLREAKAMRLPILNTNRFISVMGYVAPKAVK